MKKILILGLLPFMLIGCADKPVTTPVVHQRYELIVPTPKPATQTKVVWGTINSTNAKEKLDELKSADQGSIYYILSVQGWEDLNQNIAELRRYIVEQAAVIGAYKEYYKKESVEETAPK